MKNRLILLMLLVASPVFAVTQEVLPGYVGVTDVQASGTANQMVCAREVAWGTIAATKFAGRVTVGVAAAVSGFGIYPDSDGGAALATLTGATTSGSGVTLSATGLSTISLTAGTPYRVCFCSTSTGVNYLGVAENFTGTGDLPSLLNAVSTTIGTAAHGCTVGVPPTVTGTGALTISTVFAPPVIWLEQ